LKYFGIYGKIPAYMKMCDFRLPPRSRRYPRSSGI